MPSRDGAWVLSHALHKLAVVHKPASSANGEVEAGDSVIQEHHLQLPQKVPGQTELCETVSKESLTEWTGCEAS